MSREYDVIEIGLGLVKLGECNCPEPLIIDGEKIWASSLGTYSRNCEGCENFKPYKQGKPKLCGNCIFWEPCKGNYE